MTVESQLGDHLKRIRKLEAAVAGAAPSGASNISALGLSFGVSHTFVGSSYDLLLNQIWQNDPSFGYVVTSGSPLKAQFLTISKEGWYEARFKVNWNSDFVSTDFPFIEPRCYFVTGAFSDSLVSSAGEYWEDSGSVFGEQNSADDVIHHTLTETVYFNFSAAEFGTSVLGLGIRLRASGSRTKTFNGSVEVTWLGELLEQLTIA